ncbi:Ger(x)C family spore germination protein [Bacillus mangrovi]|uniref:Ger(X)C family spore germination protein n=1 Tax=Metabacillus mangrovi TaxID=1491830 RepID=A0A7X2S597_9BACI|nr:Ger(x)C family spore germination protein [Metabacillus mangrovi]MTH53471.1 Ger(x)C family spore germination protein [Metabacillus mangrovi]
MRKWMFLLFCLPLLSSCGTQQELNDLTIVIGMGVDAAEEGYQITLQLVDPSEISSAAGISPGGKAVPVINMVGKGASINEAFQAAVSKISRKTFYSHLAVVVIGEDLAKRGIGEMIEHLERGSEVRSSLLIMTAKDQTALEVLSALPPLTKVPALSALGKTENNLENFSTVTRINIIDWAKMNNQSGMDAFMPGIYNHGDPNVFKRKENIEQSEPYSTAVGYTAVYGKDTRLKYWLGPEETKALLIVHNQAKRAYINTPCDHEYVSYLLPYVKSESKVRYTEGKVKIRVNVKTRSEVFSLGCLKDTKMSRAVIRDLEKQMTEELEKEITDAIAASQQKQSDIYGFGEMLSDKNPQQWKSIKNQWPELFGQAEIEVHADTELLRGGVVESHI